MTSAHAELLPRKLRAIVFDVDGTLYDQAALRRAMLARLLRAYFLHPVEGFRTIRLLAAYRRAQESLRTEPPASEDIAEAQVRLACERTGAQAEEMRRCVARWMEREPLDLLPRCGHPGLREFLKEARTGGVRLAVLSDYPAAKKLAALGMAEFFEVAVIAQDPAVQCFKPNPRGLLVAIERLKIAPAETLYVGDRPDVDGTAALRAGIPCVILSDHAPKEKPQAAVRVRNYWEFLVLLREVLPDVRRGL